MIRRFALGTALALAGATSANAATLTTDAGWTYFSFDGVGSAWSDSFNFEILTPTYLLITDAFYIGDQFAFEINGAGFSILTSIPGAPNTDPAVTTDDFTTAFLNPLYSSIALLLNAGLYTISGTAYASPFGTGGAGIMLASALPTRDVPGPIAGAGLSMILGGAAWYLARRRKAAA